MDATSEAQKALQPDEPVALPAGQHGEPAVEHAQAAQPVAAGGDGVWEDEMIPLVPSVDSEMDNNSDADSGMGGMSVLSPTASLHSSIYEHVHENGRTYHRYKQGKYMLPNDELEQERLALQHALFKVTLNGKLYLAPIGPNLHEVLDIATGTGIWAIEFANDHPSARVIGTDLSAIQPLYVPPNCDFEIDDAEDEWIFEEKFDYIHGRALFTCFKDPKQLITEAVKSLRPGGYLELQDMQFPFQYIGDPPTESAVYKWNELLIEGAARAGRPWTNVQYYRHYMEELGLEDVVEKSFYWPTSMWARGRYFKDVATFFHENLLRALEGVSLRVMGILGWSEHEILDFLAGVREEIKDTSIHAYLPIKVIYGRKPLDADTPAPDVQTSQAEAEDS